MHKVLARAGSQRKVKGASCAELLELLISGDTNQIEYVTDSLTLQLSSNHLSPTQVFTCLSARLHRSVSPDGLVRVAELLVEIFHQYPMFKDALLHLVNCFADLLPLVVQIIMLTPNKPSIDFIIDGLYSWVEKLPFSSRESPLELKRLLSSLILFSVRQHSERHNDLLEIGAKFIRLLDPTARTSDLPESIGLVLQLISGFSQGGLTGDENLALAIIEFGVTCKTILPGFSSVNLIKGIDSLNCQYSPLWAIIYTHPMFNASEACAILSLCVKSGKVDKFSQIATFLILADYPYLDDSLAREGIVKNILDCSPVDTVISNHHDWCFEKVRNRLVLLFGAILRNPNFTVNNGPWGSFDYSIAVFTVETKILLESPSVASLERLTAIVVAHPVLAQRLLFLLSLVLKSHCQSRELLVSVVKCLADLGRVDEFCRERVLSLLQSLIRNSYSLRTLLLPILTIELEKHSFFFSLISENLASLVYASSADTNGALAFAICIYRLVLDGSRQSYLSLAFSSIQGVLRAKGEIRDMTLGVRALLLKSLATLISVQFISPKLVWGELARPLLLSPQDSEALKDQDYNNSFCELLSTFSTILPENEDGYEKVEPAVLEACDFLLENMVQNPSASLWAFSKFPPSFLSWRSIDIIASFSTMLEERKEVVTLDEDRLCGFLVTWLGREIANMPRSLFLGTSVATDILVQPIRSVESPGWEILDEKLASVAWRSNPLLMVAKLNLAQPGKVLSLLDQITTLPSLVMQHWLLRLEFLSLLKSAIYRGLTASLSDSATFEAALVNITMIMEERITQGQSVATISYGLFTWAFTLTMASKIDGNQQRSCQGLRRLLSGQLINYRSSINEEIQAAITICLGALWDGLEESLQKGFRSELDSFLDFIKPTIHSWLWLAHESTFGRGWPRLLNVTLIDKEENLQSVELAEGVEALQLRMLSKSLVTMKDFEDHIKIVDDNRGKESTNVSGMLLFGLGRLASKVKPTPLTWIESLLEGLSIPGPVLKKLETCYKLAGFLGISAGGGGAHPCEKLDDKVSEIIIESTSKALQSCTETRLQIWLVVLLKSTLSRSIKANNPSKTAKKVGSLNRFGETFLLGTCLDLIFDQSQTSPKIRRAILSALGIMPVLPRLDLSFLDPMDPSALRVMWKHLSTGQGDQIIINRTLIEPIIKAIESKVIQLTDSDDNNFKKLLKAVDEDERFSRRLVMALREDIITNRKLFLALIESNSAILDDPSVMVPIVDAIPIDDLKVWKALASSPIKLNSTRGLMVNFLRSGKIEDALIVLSNQADFKNLISMTLAEKVPLPLNELATCFLLSLQDSPSNCKMACHLILRVLVESAHPLVKKIPFSIQLAWMEFCQRDKTMATRISRRIAKASGLFDDYTLSKEIFILAQVY